MINAGGPFYATPTNLQLIGQTSVDWNAVMVKLIMQNLCDAIQALLKSDIEILFIDFFCKKER